MGSRLHELSWTGGFGERSLNHKSPKSIGCGSRDGAGDLEMPEKVIRQPGRSCTLNIADPRLELSMHCNGQLSYTRSALLSYRLTCHHASLRPKSSSFSAIGRRKAPIGLASAWCTAPSTYSSSIPIRRLMLAARSDDLTYGCDSWRPPLMAEVAWEAWSATLASRIAAFSTSVSP